MEKIENFTISYPKKLKEQYKIINILDRVFNICYLYETKLKKLELIKNSLLNKMFI